MEIRPLLLILYIVIFIASFYVGTKIGADEEKTPSQEELLWEIREMALEIREANEGSHMVISRMYDDTVYVPLSNQPEINRLSNEIMFLIEKELK